MPSHHHFPRHARAAAALLLATLAAGCARPLALQHEYFEPANGTIAGTSERTRHAVNRVRALQAARHGCPGAAQAPAPPGAPVLAVGPDLGTAAARKALAGLCATPIRPPVAAYGATANAYRRWVEDEVRELPDVSDTAAGAAGGS